MKARRRARAVGTGPYKLTSYVNNQRYELTANPGYALGKPKIGKLVESVVPEQQTALAALRTGEVHMVTKEFATAADRVAPQSEQHRAGHGQQLLQHAAAVQRRQAAVRQARGTAGPVRRDQRRLILVNTVLLGEGTAGSAGFWHPEAPGATPVKHTMSPATMPAIGLPSRRVRALEGVELDFGQGKCSAPCTPR
ncbi:ABC transporter substrate-binding protein [Nonomuraea sp. G32]|nr:ABC transporter substrate-binding protein [Nonomuraea sp. G32]MDP4501823.1 ABC transporter substrate-binding protein [Nonomuraea sp. G32]